MTKISRKEDLPDWFSLEKYRACKNFKAKDWHFNLFLRQEPWDHFVSCRQNHPLDRALINGTLALLRETPVQWARAKPLMTPVRPLRFSDLAERVLSDRHDPEALDVWSAVMTFDGAGSRVLHRPIGTINSPFESGYPLIVDLSAPDSVLISCFNEWLKRARSENNFLSRNRLRQKYEKWAGFGLLPYIDLTIWSQENGVKITQEFMTAILLPAIDSPGNTRIRDTVGPLAEQLMQDLSVLEAQALAEEGEGPTH